ncbi:MAG: DUF294 nucleotidyltransferase-like domain-containing protein [Ramlibacter sp.]
MNFQKTLENRHSYSESVVSKLREQIASIAPPELAVVVTGSFARREASLESDVDYFLLIDDEHYGALSPEKIAATHEAVAAAILDAGLKCPSVSGAFGKETLSSAFYRNVGGNDDTNEKLTLRLLVLLEGDWLFGQAIFNEARRRLVEDIYVRAEISDHQIARFLLNDLIRYWRTIGVDFEFKTVEAGKGWGIRNIKLVYSRKLMYFSGVLMVAETAQSTRATKVATLIELAKLTPLQRIDRVFGANCTRMMSLYANFLEQIGDSLVRARFEGVTLERNTQSEEFKRLKNAGHHFSMQLEQLLKSTYPLGHPIHHALLF